MEAENAHSPSHHILEFLGAADGMEWMHCEKITHKSRICFFWSAELPPKALRPAGGAISGIDTLR